ncbi:ROK family protein [Frankia sp. AgB32]|uniref:ROK family protein n=1 Tax=Frankia sp. AgB32 TaxID=631119 RepID=UPI00200F65D9|nr:ROK family protein [Frankia sp. AgB32]MCK9896669.1 ROK family protein [Frankia sp. AgB32]
MSSPPPVSAAPADSADSPRLSASACALALDIGGTKIAAAVVDVTGTLRGTARRPVPAPPADAVAAGEPSAEAVFGAVRDCAEQALAAAGMTGAELAGIGCGCAGPMRWPVGEVSPLNIPAWRDFPLRARLGELYADLPVRVHNDGIALAAGEHWSGAGRGVRNLLAVTVSTGVGGGLVLGDRLLHGGSGNAGHIGHVVVEADGPPCPCGGQGCVEAIAAGPHSVRRALAAGWNPAPGEIADGQALARSAAAGDAVARAELVRAGAAVGAGLASCASLLDLDAAVVAGGFAQSGPIFWEAVGGSFRRHAGLAFARRLRIMPSADPAGGALRGAAAFVLAPDRYGWSDDDPV